MKKKKYIFVFALLFIGCGWVLESCRKTANELIGQQVTLVIPPGFPGKHLFQSQPLTEAGIALGRKLFYDGILSKDGSISCGSCHEQVAAFGTFDHDLSHGINYQHSNRNAPPLFNLAWSSSFGWDGRYSSIEAVAAAHINSSIEMGESVSSVVKKIKKSSQYPVLFENAYGTKEINATRLLKALTQFTGSIVSAQTKYDSVKQNLAAFTPAEAAGYTLFKNKCSSCHAEPLFTNGGYANNGLAVTYLNDYGRFTVTRKTSDSLLFKIPSLRNLFLSYPFMHDGRFIAFSQVFDHYQNGIRNSSTLAPLLQNGIPLTVTERNVLVEFLKTLTDYTLVNNRQWSAQ